MYVYLCLCMGAHVHLHAGVLLWRSQELADHLALLASLLQESRLLPVCYGGCLAHLVLMLGLGH